MSFFKSRVLMFVAAAAVAAPMFAAGPVSTEIEPVQPFLKSTQNVDVVFSMTNTSDRPVSVLRWNTPFDGIEGNLFEVARNGELVPYLGIEYKRGVPQRSDFMILSPGETVSALVELSGSYEMSYGGEYVVRFRNVSHHHSPMKGMGAEHLDLTSNRAVIWIDGEEAPILNNPYPVAAPTKAKPVRESCDNSQKAIIADAMAEAQNIAGIAASYLGSTNSSSQRYAEWFGAYSSGRWSTVRSNFDAIDDALNNAPVEFDCKCKQRYYAYVYPAEPYKIYLCKAFWSAPLTGTDSKAGTIVHEISHFNVVAGTDDVTYGQSSCRSLADSNPNDAIRNADSHEYFAENTPYLP